jgi:hypothetical protein
MKLSEECGISSATKSTVISGGMARVVQSGTAQAFCIVTDGKKRAAMVSTNATSQGQKTAMLVTAAAKRTARCPVEKNIRFRTSKKIAGSNSNWL